MLEFSNIKVYDLKESVIACRNAMRLEMPEYTDEEFQESLVRAKKLVKAAQGKVKCHANFRTGIRVSFDMKYTQYITKQFQRYHWFDYVSSSSLMHRITKMDFSKCCNKYVTEETKENMKKYIREYNNIVDAKGEYTDLDVWKLHKYEAWMIVVSNCPMGCELFVRVSTNYEQLATIYNQRVDHKLKEDWGAFVDMVKSLPYADDLIIYNDDGNDQEG